MTLLTTLLGVLGVLIFVDACTEHNQRSCQYEGKEYQHGESFKDAEDCNTCTCTNGAVACTEMACVVIPDESNPEEQHKICSYGGHNYNNGDSFPDVDGCNTCKCINGAVGCSRMTCKPIPDENISEEEKKGCSYGGQNYEDGDSFPDSDGCNICNCIDGVTVCTYVECQTAAPTQ